MKRLVLLVASAALLVGVLALPNHPGQISWSGLSRWPIEAAVILFLLLAVGPMRGLSTAIAGVLIAASLLKMADFASFLAFNRSFNPVADLFLVEAAVGLLEDSIGGVATWAVIVCAAVAFVVLFALLRASLLVWAKIDIPANTRFIAAALAVVNFGWAVADTGHHLRYFTFEQSPPGTARTSRLAIERGLQAAETMRDLARFAQAAHEDPLRDIEGLFNRLDGRDVVLIWVESYGRASFDNPLYAPTHGATLQTAQANLQRAGLAMKSGWLTSPTSGGQSWLAHGALASGLWTSDNARYRAMIASGQRWLFHYAQRAGYRTSAFMPAITLAWPESAAMGFDLIFEAKDIPYEGEPFNWVTMPDQFTLAKYRSLLPDDERPDFIQIALISSHAPWTPVPDLLPWEQIGDGREFNSMAAQGPTPRALWKDRDAVRDAYRRSVDYVLRAVFSHIERGAKDAPLIVVAGDHQAAGFVAGSDNKDVPVHIIGPPEVVSMIDHWDWSSGLVPASDGPVRRMDQFRDDFIRAFTSVRQMAGVR